MDLVGHGLQKQLQEFPSDVAVSLLHQLSHRELAGSVDGHKEIELASIFRIVDVDMKEADRVALETQLLGLVDVHFRQARDAMPLKASMQRRARKMRDLRLQGIETVVQRKQRAPTEGDDHGFLLFAEDS